LAGILLVSCAGNRPTGISVSALRPTDTPAVSDRVTYDSYQRALENLRFDFAEEHRIEGELGALSLALESVVTGDLRAADRRWIELERSDNADLAQVARMIRDNLMFDAGDYRSLADRIMERGDDPPPIVAALARVPPQQIDYGEDPVATGLKLGANRRVGEDRTAPGSPLVDVEANGTRIFLWFDTGASLTVLTETLARRLDVEVVEGFDLSLSTSTSIEVPSRIGWLRELRLGSVTFHNHPVFIMRDSDLTFERDGSTLTVEGIVGWNAIRHATVELDYADGWYRATEPVARDYGVRNFFWLGYPMTRIQAGNGQSLLFGVDTGAGNTSITENIFTKLDFAETRTETVTIEGAGGSERVETDVVDELALVITGHRFVLPDVRRESSDDAVFIVMDGVLGSDLARRTRMTVDFTNGYFAIELAGRR
jgi:predicted aspartyl protease